MISVPVVPVQVPEGRSTSLQGVLKVENETVITCKKPKSLNARMFDTGHAL